MLNSASGLGPTFVPAPSITEKKVKVRILRAVYVHGVAAEVGSTVSMNLSDAHSLRTSMPPTVEIL